MSTSNQSTVNINKNKLNVIILGNTGVGKSFLVNILFNKEILKNYCNQSLTRRTECQEITFGDCKYTIFDTPGLIEVDQRRIDINKREIDKAFTQRADSIVIYVFGRQNDRIRDEDIVGFNAINAAYLLDIDSLLLVVNNHSGDRSTNYEGETMFMLPYIIETTVSINRIFFLNSINIDSFEERQNLKSQLLRAIIELSPAQHTKLHDICLIADEITMLKNSIFERIRQFETNKNSHECEIHEEQKRYDAFIVNRKHESHPLSLIFQIQPPDFKTMIQIQHAENSELLSLKQKLKSIETHDQQSTTEILNKSTQLAVDASKQAQIGLQKRIIELENQPREIIYRTKTISNSAIVDLAYILMGMCKANEICQLGDIILPSLRQTQHNIIKFSMISNEPTTSTIQQSTCSTSREQYRISNNDQNIEIVCLNIIFDVKSLFPKYETKTFDDDFRFIAHILSIQDKTLFVIISADMAAYVVPLIQNHVFIENIYLFNSDPKKLLVNPLVSSKKITDHYTNLLQLQNKVEDDINMMQKFTSGGRSTDLFTMLNTQQLKIQRNSTIEISTDKPYNEWIVVLHCDNRKLFDIDSSPSPLIEFLDVNDCIQFITKQLQIQIFLVISGNKIPDVPQKITDFRLIHAIYFFQSIRSTYPIDGRKIVGSYTTLEDLTNQLHIDIFRFRKEHIYAIRIDLFSKIEQKNKLIPQFNEKQMDFLLFNLFIDILPQIPMLDILLKHRKNDGKSLFIQDENTKGIICDSNMLDILYKQLSQEQYTPEFSQLLLRFHKLNELTNLFLLQTQLIGIQRQVFESRVVSLSHIVYITKVVSKNDFEMMEVIKSNHNEILSIGIFLLATESFETARDIARQAAINDHISVLFEIEVMHGTHLLKVSHDHVIFRLGTVFRLQSINKGLDGVQYIKLKCADSELESIKQQLQFEMEVPLTWLTFGNYLLNLNHFEQAIIYYEYLLDKLPSEHRDRASICNNMGWIYTTVRREVEANRYYDLALAHAKSIRHNSTKTQTQDQLYTTNSISNITLPTNIITHSVIEGNIADIYYNENKRDKALEFYKKAFESATDQRCRFYYQQMIAILSKKH